MKIFLLVLIVILLSTGSALARLSESFQDKKHSVLRGRVTDTASGEPVAKVKIIVIGFDRATTTDEEGRFVLQDLPYGEVELYISTIGFGLVKKKAIIKEGEEANLEIALSPEAAPQLAQITVTAGPFGDIETNAASEQTLNKSELQKLSLILVGDPVRAAQALPGVVGNDDFRSDFALRGAGFNRIGFFIDGIQLPENPVHTKFGDDNAGSISILNADAISSISLLSGALPSRYGDNTAGAIQLETREGNRVKPSGRIAASLLSSSATFDGPFASKRGDWLATARKSYLGYLLKRLNEDESSDENFVIDFIDAQARAVYDCGQHHQIGINMIMGRSSFDQDRNNLELNDVLKSNSLIWLVYARWNYTAGPRLALQTRVFNLRGDFINENPGGVNLQEGGLSQTGVRADVDFLAHPEHRIEAGIYLRRIAGDGLERIFSSGQPPSLFTLAKFDRRSDQQGYYFQDTWSSKLLHLNLTGGARIDHYGLTDQTVVTPRAALSFAPREDTRIRLGWGQQIEFPGFNEIFGFGGNTRLRAERATHYNMVVEHLINDKTRIAAEVYDREDRDLLFRLNDVLIRDGQVIFLNSPFRNSLRGYARGFELSVHRRSANRLTGRISYSYSKARLKDKEAGFDFASDFDQRHTISTYASYRMTDTLNLSGQWRYGSGLPMVGFFQEVDGQIVLGSERNRVRLPVYSRLDMRISKAFYFKRSKLTLSGEVLNALGRDNFRQDGRGREKLLPFLPSVGVAFEF